MVHTMFRREFGLMPALVRSVSAGDIVQSQIVADHVELVNTILHHHHSAEDKHLWPRLLARGSGEVGPVVHLAESQHENVERVRAEIDRAIEVWRRSAASESRQALADAIDRIIPALIEHMDVEDARILPLVEKYITAAEWEAMVEDVAGDIPQDALALIFGMIMYGGDPQVVELTLSNMPVELRSGMKERASQAFAAYAERVYGTATPPRSKAIA